MTKNWCRIIAFLKSLPEVEGPGANVSLGPIGCIGVAVGQFKTVAQLIAETVSPLEAKGDEAVLRSLSRADDLCIVLRDRLTRRF